MNKQKNYRRRQRGITPITTPRNSPGVAQFSMSEVAQFSMSLDKTQQLCDQVVVAGAEAQLAGLKQGGDGMGAARLAAYWPHCDQSRDLSAATAAGAETMAGAGRSAAPPACAGCAAAGCAGRPDLQWRSPRRQLHQLWEIGRAVIAGSRWNKPSR